MPRRNLRWPISTLRPGCGCLCLSGFVMVARSPLGRCVQRVLEGPGLRPWLKPPIVPQVVSSYELAPVALLVFGTDNLVRKPLIRLVRLPIFEWFMLTVILANCVTLAMDSNKPGFSESTTGRALVMSNYVFIALFIFEAACKIIALGFVFAEHTYLRSGETAVPCTCHAMRLHSMQHPRRAPCILGLHHDSCP